MKPAAFLLAVALAASAAAPSARAQDYVYMLSTGELRSLIDQGKKDMVIGYISGVMDTMMRAREFCVPEGFSPGDIGARAYKLMSQQDRMSKAPAADVLAVYLHGDFRCPK